MLKIVFIDDEALALDLLKCIIDWEKIGFIVSGTARNGLLGLQLCENVKPDVVIVDINMPKMDGLAFIKALKKAHYTTKIIVLSAYDESEAIWVQGISAYLLKPLDENRLIEEILKIRKAILSI